MFKLLIASNMRSVLLITFVGTALFFGVSSTLLLFRQKMKVLVIRVSQSGTEVIEEDSVKDRNGQDKKNIINMYVALAYSFSNKSYNDRIAKALELVSLDLYKSELIKAKKELEAVEKRSFTQDVVIEKFDDLADGIVQLDIVKNVVERGDVSSFRSVLTLSLAPIERFKENPYGYEITSILEEKRY